jgi:hypothetical protein
MADPTHALMIPVEGLAEILHSEFPIDGPVYLRTHNAKAGINGGGISALTFPLLRDGDEEATLHFMRGPGMEANMRARAAVARLTGVHIVITGPAILVGLSPERTVQAMRDWTEVPDVLLD